jgi:hypothetical protein
MRFKRYSEWIKEEKPDITFEIDWEKEKLVGIHPVAFEQRILALLRRNNIPVLGTYSIEGIAKGRLYWSDFDNLGSRTFYYHKAEPTYTKEAKDPEYNICRLICPICKELCGGVSDHIEETKDYLTPETEFHGCINEHRWLELDSQKRVKYLPMSSPTFSNVRFKLEDIDEDEDEEHRAIRLKD